MQDDQFRDLGTIGFRAAFCLLAEDLFAPFLEFLPFFLGAPFRWVFLKVFSRKIGRQLFIARQVAVRHCYNLTIGSHVGINQGSILHCRGGVTIGNDVLMGQRVIINTGDHDYADSSILIREQPTTYKSIVIGNDVFLGMGAMILPGVTVADGTVVAAGAVVTQDTEPYSVVAGVPARVIRRREPRSATST